MQQNTLLCKKKVQYATIAACCFSVHGSHFFCTEDVSLLFESSEEGDCLPLCLQVATPATNYCDCFLCYLQTTGKL